MRRLGFVVPSRVRTAVCSAALIFALVVNLVPVRLGAADDKQLQRLKGNVGYQTAGTAPFTSVIGKFSLPDDYFAVTQATSAGLLVLPDSSLVGLGENTRVQVGAFNQTADGPGATITVNGGTLRFDIRRPVGGTANYHFATTTTQMAVRGTVGLLSFVNGVTTVACVVCAADSVAVTVGTQTFTLLTGQLLTISAAGVVAAGAVTAVALGAFTGAGVSTSAATGVTAATTGVATGAGAAAAGSAAATTAVVAGGAVAAGVAAAVIVSQPSPSPAPSPTASPAPAPTATCSSTGVPINVQGYRKALATCPTPVPVQVQGKPALPPTSLGGQRHAP